MSSGDRPPDARPLFRMLAFGVAVVCFVLAAVFRFASPEAGVLPQITCLVVRFIMLVIGGTGFWPPRSRK
jgi:hypothetical protein